MIWSFFPLPLTSTPSLRPYPAFTRTLMRGKPQRAPGQEVHLTDRRGPISRTATGKPMASPRLLFTSIHLRERFPRICSLTICRLSRKSSQPPRRPMALALMKTMVVGPTLTSLGSMTRGLYVASSASATTSLMAATPTMAATSLHGHDTRRQRLHTTSTRHDR
jgi:hypothetical protein